jgi:hypothetical protein
MNFKDVVTLSPLAFFVGFAVAFLVAQTFNVPDFCSPGLDIAACQMPESFLGVPRSAAAFTWGAIAAVVTFAVEWIIKLAKAAQAPH